jgi:hypothetical protein
MSLSLSLFSRIPFYIEEPYPKLSLFIGFPHFIKRGGHFLKMKAMHEFYARIFNEMIQTPEAEFLVL